MTAFRLTSFPLLKWNRGMFSVSLSLTENTPTRTFEAKSVTECAAELDRFAEELKATGKPYMASVRHVQGSGRKPAGFDRADLKRFVNKEQVTVS